MTTMNTSRPRAPPKNVSLTDPAARWPAAPGDLAFYAYSTNYLTDLQAGVIVDVQATPAHRTQEVDGQAVDRRRWRAGDERNLRGEAKAPLIAPSLRHISPLAIECPVSGSH
jgi:hypothetical protein